MRRKRFVSYATLLLLAVLILSQSGWKLHARTLTLAGVSANITDLTASTNMRRDLNGEPCALLKVAFNKPGLAFEGSVIGYVSYTAGEYLVYVTANTRFLKVKHQDFDPLEIDFKLTEIGPLEGKKVYMVKLQAEGEEGQPVTFIVRPSNAELIVDFKKYPTVDGRAEIRLTHGEHSYSVASSGYEMQSRRFMVYADNDNRQVIELDRQTDSQSAVASKTSATSQTTITAAQTSTVVQPSTSESITSNTINGHEYVDLGLPSGLKWATCNVGAKSPSDYGDYFAWGETSPKSKYTKKNNKTYGKEIGNISGKPTHDAAAANWGASWRMPTKDELKELRQKCQWTWTMLDGIKGYKILGTNGESIFLPAAGYADRTFYNGVGSSGHYWSSTFGELSADRAFVIDFFSSGVGINNDDRYYGRSVRPVSD